MTLRILTLICAIGGLACETPPPTSNESLHPAPQKAADRSPAPAPAQPGSAQPKPDMPAFDLQLIPEMQDLPAPWMRLNRQHAQTQDCDRHVAEQWPRLAEQLARQLGSEQLASLSKWAKPQMTNYKPREGWLSAIRPQALFHVGRSRNLVYGPDSKGAPRLPSHSELVERKLFVFVECQQNQAEPTLGPIYVTIRGQLQE